MAARFDCREIKIRIKNKLLPTGTDLSKSLCYNGAVRNGRVFIIRLSACFSLGAGNSGTDCLMIVIKMGT